MEETDRELITRHRAGDETALPELINRYLKPIYRFIFRRIGKTTDSEDLTQETFLKIWKNLRKYRAEESFRAWAFTIARHTAIDWLRKKKSLTFSELADTETENEITFSENLRDPDPLPDELSAKAGDNKFLNDVIDKLPSIYQEVLTLRYEEDLTFDEISRVLDKPLDTIKSQHRRALITLRKMLINTPVKILPKND